MEADALTLEGILWRLALALLLVLANAFFVAAEFALVGARRTRIDALAEQGSRRARMARTAIQNLDHYISGTQVGITLASLGLGWVGETTIAEIIRQAFDGLAPPWNVVATHGVAGTAAFVLITFMHIVLGELAPKSLALLFPEKLSMWTAGPLIGFSRLLGPFIALLNGSANLLLRALGLRAPTEVERVHRPEEIELLLTQSYEHGLLSEEPVEMIRGVFDLSETTAAEVMTPRTEVVAVPVDATLEDVADVIIEAGHSRIPVYRDSLDQVLGVVLAREVWRALRRGSPTSLEDLIRPVPFVPDSKPIEDLLREMQAERTHIAVVVDEWGGTAGIVTIEDVIEEIVGEIRDEHEEEPPPIEEKDGEVLVSGGFSIAELNELYDLSLPEQDYTTVAGYVLGQLGRIPRAGDEVLFAGGRLRVLSMDGRRIERLGLVLDGGLPERAEEGAAER